jgi:hypothetical protein
MGDPADNDRDDALLRRLYDEPDADSADGELAREVESYKRVRSAIASYARATEVEPPARGVDELLAAARQRAPARTAVAPESPGWWARLRAWLAPIAAHPALASAAMVVVVAAIGGVLYVKGKGQVAEPEVGAARPAEIKVDTPNADSITPSDPGIVAGLDDGHTGDKDVAERPQAQMTPPASETKDVQTKPPVKRPEPRPRKPPTTTGKEGETRYSGGGNAGEGEGTKVDSKTAGDVSVGPGRVKVEGGDDNSGLAPVFESTSGTAQAPTAPPPPPPPQAPNSQAEATEDGDQFAGDYADEKTKSTSKGPDVQQLTRQARTAAKSGDCAVVKAIGGKVKKANASYYKQTFATDAAIKKCL